ncbi:LLM class F420-dependent oxidoreductase [Saccharothrix sp. Mg75]|uniref:LLM class F420-dependent oxidoreductase n=1 Tax=Saccharothrix sp. Mg75 TaxID=3445357 RepID=UPI003EEB9383
MRAGAIFPQTEIGDDPEDIRTWARSVEEIGYAHALVFDHVAGADFRARPNRPAYDHETPFHEVFVLLGFLAAVTTRLELATGVLVLPQRQTVLVAKQAAEVDVLSGGRLRLGVGIGWNSVEYEALGEDFTNRGARSAEQVELMRLLWARPSVDFRGRWHTVDHAGIKPRPAAGRVPVWFGGNAEPVLRRAGRLGDGWLPQRAPDAVAADMLRRVRGYAAEAGRDPGALGFEPRLKLSEVPERDWASFAAGWRELGATHLCVSTMGLGLGSVDEHLAVLRDVLPIL